MKKTEPTPKRTAKNTIPQYDITSNAFLGVLNIRHSKGAPMYLGSVDLAVIAERRAKNKRARKQRKANNRKASK